MFKEDVLDGILEWPTCFYYCTLGIVINDFIDGCKEQHLYLSLKVHWCVNSIEGTTEIL